MSKTRLEERQREMAERIAGRVERLRRQKQAAKVQRPKPKRWLISHMTEVLERLIDDLGLDVPRRDKQLTAQSS